MKVCPVCNALAFDDAPICYGCLYRFEEEGDCSEGDREPDAWVGSAADEGAKVDMLAVGEVGEIEEGESSDGFSEPPCFSAPEFLIRFTPIAGVAGSVTWSCAVEPVGC